jgi:flagellar biosynthesis GTPase FlhF
MTGRRAVTILLIALLGAGGAAGVWFAYRPPAPEASVAAALPDRRSGANTDSASSSADRLALLDNSLRAIADGDRESPRDRWDPDYVVATIGREPQQLADWVRAYTYWIPYRGMLRGATGVLMDGQGNSLDRAVLLATLLQKAGHTVRLAHAELSRDQALELVPVLANRRTEAFRPGPAVPLVGAADLREATAHYALDAERSTTAAQESFTRAATEAKARVADQSIRLLRSIEAPETQSDWGRRFTAAMDAVRDHWWVQRLAGGRWVDIDVTDSDDRSHAPIAGDGEAIPLEAAPDDGRSHELTVRVIAERWSSSGLTLRRALEHVVRPHEIFGRPLVLQFWPGDAFESVAPAPASNMTAEPEKSWGILLLTGDTVAATGLLQANGDDPDAAHAGGIGGLGSAIAGAFGTNDTEAADAALTAVWIEYEIRTPGAPPETIRRAVFDLIGPAARAASPVPPLAMDEASLLVRRAAMTMRTEMLPIVCRVAPEFVAHLMAQTLLGNRELLRTAAGNAESAAVADRLAESAAPTVSGLYALALARTAWSRRPGVLFDDRISLFTKHLFRGVSDGRPVVFDATDIVASRSGVDLDERDGFAARLEQGVLDTNAEALVHFAQTVTGNAGTAYKTSRSWTPVGGADTLDALALPADTKERIRQDLAAGYVVVAPDAAIPDGTETFAGWWRIDPVTGDTLGFGPHGWGVVMGERGAQQTWSQAAMAMMIKMGKQFASVFAVSYLWCAAAITEPAVEKAEKGFRLGAIRASLVASPEECLGDSVAYGIFAAVTVPLLALAVEGSVISTRPPRSPKPANAAPPKPATPAEPPPPPPECPPASPKATTGEVPGAPPLPEFPPEEATISPGAVSTEMPAASGGGNSGGSGGAGGPAPPRPRYAPWWDGPLSPEEFQEYRDWTEYNRARAENEAATARDRYRAAADTYKEADAAAKSADAKYQQAKAADSNSPEAQDAYVKRNEAARASSRAQTEANEAAQQFSRKSAVASEEKVRSDYSKRIADANQKLYDARQAYNRAIQKFNDWQRANPKASACGTDPGYEQQWDAWAKAKQAWEAAQSEFYKDAMFGQDPPAVAENPTVPDNSPAPRPPAPQPVAPGPASPDPALDKTQPQPDPSISGMAKTLSGASGVKSAIKNSGN